MKDLIAGCEQFNDNRSTPSVSEKGKTFQLNNNKNKRNVRCIKIDGCVFVAKDGKKCDYLFEVLDKVYLIELKGSDVVEGVRQLYQTILKFKKYYNDWTIEARLILGNRVPASIKNAKEYELLYAEVVKKNGSIIIKNQDLYKEAI